MKRTIVYLLIRTQLAETTEELSKTIIGFSSKKKVYEFIKPPTSYQAFARKIKDSGYSELDKYKVLPLKLNQE